MPRLAVICALAVLTAACGRQPEPKEYELQGQILGIEPARNEVLIRHQDIEGFMPAMQMPFTVKDPALLEGRRAGDLITATLVVGEVDAYLSAITTTGHAELEAPPTSSDAPRILAPGDEVADARLVDQDGTPRPFSSFRGHRVALTFIYTRCPLPTFCPLMDQNFATIQRAAAEDPVLSGRVRLVSISFDPEHDTPAALARHAARLKADPAVWTFLTGDRVTIDRFAARFGVGLIRPAGAAEITHNLRTVLIGADGRIAKIYAGSDWTPSQAIADLRAAVQAP